MIRAKRCVDTDIDTDPYDYLYASVYGLSVSIVWSLPLWMCISVLITFCTGDTNKDQDEIRYVGLHVCLI